MITGASTVEAVIPGSPGAIQAGIDQVQRGASRGRDVSQAWQQMRIAAWTGRGATKWQAFVPQEAHRAGLAPAAFTQTRSALVQYQAAFLAARADVQAAINDAARAEHTSVEARSEYGQALRRASLADPGTPEAVLKPFSDPGAGPLAEAQSRAEAARTRCDRAGNEAAAMIRAAARQVSGGRTRLNTGAGGGSAVRQVSMRGASTPWMGSIVVGVDPGRVRDFGKGVLLELVDIVVGLGTLAYNGLRGMTWDREGVQRQNLLAAYAFYQDPKAALKAWLLEMLRVELWSANPAEASGRTTVDALTFFFAPLKLAKVSKFGPLVKTTGAAERLPGLLRGSKGVSVQGGRVVVSGVDKMSVGELATLYERSVHNMDAKQATLGSFKRNDASSYEQVARESGDAHFNLEGTGWSDAKAKYGVNDGQLYELLNRPFLEEVAGKKLPVRFTHDPTSRDVTPTLEMEYLFLKDAGYVFDPSTKTMFP